TRRRFGRWRIELDGHAAALGASRHSSESSDSLSTTTTATGRLYSRRTAGVGSTRQVCERCLRLCLYPSDPSPDIGVRSCRLTGWASNVDLREVSGMERQQR